MFEYRTPDILLNFIRESTQRRYRSHPLLPVAKKYHYGVNCGGGEMFPLNPQLFEELKLNYPTLPQTPDATVPLPTPTPWELRLDLH